MISANEFLESCLERGFTFFTGTPCSYLKPIINYVIDHDKFSFIGATNEGDAVAIAAGVTLAGGKSVVMFQNSGLGNAVNPLTSLTSTLEIPMLLLVTLRGEPGGEHDEPQHALMGAITTRMLETMRIPWRYLPENSSDISPAMDEAERFMKNQRTPFAFVVRKQHVTPYALQSSVDRYSAPRDSKVRNLCAGEYRVRPTRLETLCVIQRCVPNSSTVIGTTGYTGRELFSLEDRANQLYMVGSMGCALPLGFGVAVRRPDVQVFVVDGDGALLMRTGTMATVGTRKPQNLIHIVLDNECHESTGGQATASAGISFSTVACGFGYDNVYATDELVSFEQFLKEAASGKGPTFIHCKIKAGTDENLKRPTITPRDVRRRFSQYLSQLSQEIV